MAYASFAILLGASIAAGQVEPRSPIALLVQVGESASICPCPVFRIVCDEPGLVDIVESEIDVRLKGVRPGKTLCSATNAAGFRVFYDVTVVPNPER